MSFDCFGRLLKDLSVKMGIKSSSGDIDGLGGGDGEGEGRVGHVDGTGSDSAFSSGVGGIGGRDVYCLLILQQVVFEVEEGIR